MDIKVLRDGTSDIPIYKRTCPKCECTDIIVDESTGKRRCANCLTILNWS